VALLLAAGAGVIWLSRPLSPPRVLRTTQITRDGTPKATLLTDGTRIYLSEQIGLNKVLVQGSASGGETSFLAKPFDNFGLSDISPDNSELLIIDHSGLATVDRQAWMLPLPSGSLRPLGNIQAHDATWSPDGKQIAFAKGSNILLADADGTNPRQLISVAGSPSMMRFSPDGTRIRFTLGIDNPQNNLSSIWEVRSDGKDLHPCCRDGTIQSRNAAEFGRPTVVTISSLAVIQAISKSMPCGNRAGYFVSLPNLTRSHRDQCSSHLAFRLPTGRDF